MPRYVHGHPQGAEPSFLMKCLKALLATFLIFATGIGILCLAPIAPAIVTLCAASIAFMFGAAFILPWLFQNNGYGNRAHGIIYQQAPAHGLNYHGYNRPGYVHRAQSVTYESPLHPHAPNNFHRPNTHTHPQQRQSVMPQQYQAAPLTHGHSSIGFFDSGAQGRGAVRPTAQQGHNHGH